MDNKKNYPGRTLRFVLFVCVIIGCWYLGRVVELDMDDLRQALSRQSILSSGLVFITLYVVATTFIWFGPKDVLRILSAVLFGANISTAFVFLAEVVNAAILFSFSRILGRDFIVSRFKVKPQDLNRLKGDSGLLGVAAVRLNPLIPFRLMDLGFGLSSISLKKYLTVVIAVSAPRIFLFQFILAGVGEAFLKDFAAVYHYLMANQAVVFYSSMYLLAVVVLSIAAVVRKKSGQGAN